MLHGMCRNFKRAPQVGALLFCVTLSTQVLATGPRACAADRIDERATVQAVYDGDTIRLSDQRVVRFIGVNTPELAHDTQPAEPFAEEAARALRERLPVGSRVGLRFDSERQDRHRRTLAHVFTEQGVNLSAMLIEQGYGFAIAVAPNAWQVECYFGLEQAAREARRGIWSHSFSAARPAAGIDIATRGFMRISGRVINTGKSRKNIWLDLGPRVALKVPRAQLHSFAGLPIETLRGRDIIARGWVNFYNGKLRMTVSHPAMLEILD